MKKVPSRFANLANDCRGDGAGGVMRWCGGWSSVVRRAAVGWKRGFDGARSVRGNGNLAHEVVRRGGVRF
ncbi:hypothetical protein KF728_21625 [Candidatus Obscuribacterales bacterium]|nr:hypothetical protein [Candidatus Obscuribacterales bacterium]MBX3152773.1 hypothetical protein [Candidatus Obscuribacterales bacterium]